MCVCVCVASTSCICCCLFAQAGFERAFSVALVLVLVLVFAFAFAFALVLHLPLCIKGLHPSFVHFFGWAALDGSLSLSIHQFINQSTNRYTPSLLSATASLLCKNVEESSLRWRRSGTGYGRVIRMNLSACVYCAPLRNDTASNSVSCWVYIYILLAASRLV